MTFEHFERLGKAGVGFDDPGKLEKFAPFLRDVGAAWPEANEQQRNELARTLFERSLENQTVRGVTPKPELKPFFDLQYLERSL